MNIINKDIFTVESGIIVNQTNCAGGFGGGLRAMATQIRNKWPKVYEEYVEFCSHFAPENLLGQIQFVRVSPPLSICNLFGQLNYGPKGKRYTSYGAWEKALSKLNELELDEMLYFPYLIGANLGGGNWEIISRLIDEYLPNAIICQLSNL